jgi:c-di-GMP-binding flagellar brake protein YcgR
MNIELRKGGNDLSYREKLTHGLLIDIVVQDGEYTGSYRSRVEEVGARLLSVGALYEKGEVIPLREGTKVMITFCDELSAYEFEAEIMQRIAVPVPILVLELPDIITKIQRRSFVRVPVTYPVTFRRVNGEGLSDLHKGTMLDLSGGGMNFLTEELLEKGSLLYVQLGLPNGDIQTPVRVCRTEKTEDNKRYRVTTEFSDLSERERDQIIRCVFERQRAMRKKGLV